MQNFCVLLATSHNAIQLDDVLRLAAQKNHTDSIRRTTAATIHFDHRCLLALLLAALPPSLAAVHWHEDPAPQPSASASFCRCAVVPLPDAAFPPPFLPVERVAPHPSSYFLVPFQHFISVICISSQLLLRHRNINCASETFNIVGSTRGL